MALEGATEIELGLGWPNVGWAKGAMKANLPPMYAGFPRQWANQREGK